LVEVVGNAARADAGQNLGEEFFIRFRSTTTFAVFCGIFRKKKRFYI